MDNEFVSVAEAARRLNVSRMLLTLRIHNGLLPAFENPRDLRQRLIRTSDVEALMQIRPLTAPRKETAATAA